jgi:hypothetical protein
LKTCRVFRPPRNSFSRSKFIVEQAFQPVRKAGQTIQSVLQASNIGSTEFVSWVLGGYSSFPLFWIIMSLMILLGGMA